MLKLLISVIFLSTIVICKPTNEEETETSLTDEDFNNANQISDIEDTEAYKVEEKAGLFEGDIARDAKIKIRKTNIFYSAVSDRRSLWLNAVIPYAVSSLYSSDQRANIAKAFDYMEKNTCLRFKSRDSTNTNYIYIRPEDGCFSNVGKLGGKQIISLDKGCFSLGTIVHELMHAAGFYHEQSRPDRDDYVIINDDNIEVGAASQFLQYGSTMIRDQGIGYDYSSIMHYGAKAFSRNGLPTITPKQPNAIIGQRSKLSDKDIQKVQKLYNCTKLEPSCIDYRYDCEILADRGFCSVYDWMSELCSKSCACARTEPIVKTKVKCKDKSSIMCKLLGQWCQSKALGSLARYTCPKSCHKC